MPRTVVIGLDAFHTDLLEHTPFIRSLYSDRLSGELRSTTPPVTAPAWASFQTGKNQGKHGIYHFVTHDEEMNTALVDGTKLRSKTFYELLDGNGQDCLLYNLPYTLPARIDGDIVPSWLDPEDSDPVPADLYSKYDIAPSKYPEPTGADTQQLSRMRDYFDHNRSQFLELLRAADHDFLFQLVSVTDWAQHTAYRQLQQEPNGRVSGELTKLLEDVDEYVREVHSLLADEDTLILLSDHGFKLFDGMFYLNDWLKREGLLQTGGTTMDTKDPIDRRSKSNNRSVNVGRVGQFLARQKRLKPILRRIKRTIESSFGVKFGLESGVDFAESTAFCLSKDEGAIHINETVPPERREEIISDILAKLGTQPGISVSRADDLYHGPFADEAGDVIVHSGEYKVSRGPVGTIQTSDPLAHHSSHGIMIHCGISDTDLTDAHLMDVAPTLLALSGIPVPEDMDGRPLPEVVGSSVEYADYAEYAAEFSAGDESASTGDVEQRLSDLGYL